jgi:hypothetical protein
MIEVNHQYGLNLELQMFSDSEHEPTVTNHKNHHGKLHTCDLRDTMVFRSTSQTLRRRPGGLHHQDMEVS